ERRVLEGVPGLSDLPIVGRMFAHTRKETQETDIVLTLTPRIIRVLDLTENDLRPFRVGRETGNSVVDLPVAVPPPPPPQPQAPAQQPPAQQPPFPQQPPNNPVQPVQPPP